MKIRKIFYSILFFCVSQYSFGQITNYPSVESITSGITIERVEINEENTIITVLCKETRSSILMPYILFPPLTLMMDDKKGTGVAIQSLGEYEIGVKYSTVKNSTYRFRLFFSPLDPGVEKISVVSVLKDQYGNQTPWFSWKGITINNPPIPKYNPKSKWSEVTIKNYYLSNSKDSREGIYERVTSDEDKYKLALVKNNEGFELIYLNSNKSNIFKEGDIKAYLINTASENIFKVKWIMSDRTLSEDLYITFSELFMKVIWTNGNGEDSYLKLFPTSKDQTPQNRESASSGTGFLISDEGYIVTNHHVIKNANKITVRGLNGDFSRSVSAKLVIEDVKNDLAIIKTDEYQTPKLTEPPFTISNKRIEPGNSIFCLGYPLRSTMGEEVKITNGIISSNSGFKGDITSYQISAPVQPGNSGGPLFDDKGNLVGIINAKHSGTENVSYAIKSSYLLNLINSAPKSIKLQQINKISNLSLPEKIKVVKKYTYIIETN
jgi:S1-C subfamily serine protease